MNRFFKWFALICCMIAYGELRVMSFFAAMFGGIIAISALIYAAIDMSRPQQRVRRRSNDE